MGNERWEEKIKKMREELTERSAPKRSFATGSVFLFFSFASSGENRSVALCV
jgi:hypothetical protein